MMPSKSLSSSRQQRSSAFRRLAFSALLLVTLPDALAPRSLAANAPEAGEVSSRPGAGPATISVSSFQARLQSLDRLIVACQQAMTPANCKSDSVGEDNIVSLPSGPRAIRYAWLRDLLARAGNEHPQSEHPLPSPSNQSGNQRRNAPAGQPDEFDPPKLAQQMEDARKRLATDAEWTASITGNPDSNRTPKSVPQRQILTRILAAKEYQSAAAGPSLLEQLLEKVGGFLDRILARLQQAGFQSRWVGLTAEVVFVVAVCVFLVWFLIRLERQGRVAASFHPGSGADAVSARDWQLWLQDARSAAAQGAWRDAIHFTYWASISRLESSGLWPADRARTPREYLALLSPESAARPGLITLTRSFERTWYAGLPAAEVDFREAEHIASQIGAKSRIPAGPR